MVDLELNRRSIHAFCERYPIQRMSLFGSVLRSDFSLTSDVDLLVQFTPGARIGLLDIAGMEHELSGIIGRKADLRTAADLSPYFRDEVVQSSQTIYERS